MANEHETSYDAQGSPVESREAGLKAFARVAAASATACLNLINGGANFKIEVTFNPNSYPFHITGGKITGNICGAPWAVTGGSMGSNLRIEAKRQGSGSCADTICITGSYQVPPSWTGTYGFNGSCTMFNHTTLFKGFNPC